MLCPIHFRSYQVGLDCGPLFDFLVSCSTEYAQVKIGLDRMLVRHTLSSFSVDFLRCLTSHFSVDNGTPGRAAIPPSSKNARACSCPPNTRKRFATLSRHFLPRVSLFPACRRLSVCQDLVMLKKMFKCMYATSTSFWDHFSRFPQHYHPPLCACWSRADWCLQCPIHVS